jgi:hypothetical protein
VGGGWRGTDAATLERLLTHTTHQAALPDRWMSGRDDFLGLELGDEDEERTVADEGDEEVVDMADNN